MTLSPDLPAPSPTWIDAFPWLAHVLPVEESAWHDDAIADDDPAHQTSVARLIARTVLAKCPSWTVAQVVPALRADVALASLVLPTRARNVIRREGVTTIGDLAGLTVAELMAWQNMGYGSVSALIAAVAEDSVTQIAPTLSTAWDEGWGDQPGTPLSLAPIAPSPAPIPARWAATTDALDVLARWNQLMGRTDAALLDPLPWGAPAAVVAARAALLQITAEHWVNPDPAAPTSWAEMVEAQLSAFDERQRILLAERVFSWNPSTLEELGQQFGVTRERVRQIEKKALVQLRALLGDDSALGECVTFMRAEIRGVRPLQELLDVAPALADPVPTLGEPLWRIVDVLDDEYEIADGWCAEPSFDAARRDTEVFLEDLADDHGVVRLADVSLTDSEAEDTLPWLRDWLTHLGHDVRDDVVLLRTGSVQDLAAAMLSLEGAPLTLDELHTRVGRGTLNSLRNQVAVDPRFTKVGRDHHSLTEWGLEEYTSIRGEIGKMLDEADGERSLAEIRDALVSRFGVSASSVAVYASSAPYALSGGMVRYAGRVRFRGKDPFLVRGYYRSGDDWLFRTTVTDDHLRGSGWPASTALPRIVRIGPGEATQWPSRLGEQSFYFNGHQPAFGTIRRFLEDLGCEAGDEVMLRFGSDGVFDVVALGQVPEGLAGVLMRAGCDPALTGDAAINALATAMGVDGSASVARVAARFDQRREPDLSDALVAAMTGGDDDVHTA